MMLGLYNLYTICSKNNNDICPKHISNNTSNDEIEL